MAGICNAGGQLDGGGGSVTNGLACDGLVCARPDVPTGAVLAQLLSVNQLLSLGPKFENESQDTVPAGSPS